MMDDRQQAIAQVEAWVRETLELSGATAHGWLHTARVRDNILILARAEGVDPWMAELAALLHDVGRTLPGPGSEHGARSASMAVPVLAKVPLTADERDSVLHAIRWHNSGREDTLLLRILRDADMLDALGATGIMRALMSKAHLPPYDPATPFEEANRRWPTIYASDQVLGQMTFYNWLHTGTARQMAKDRIAFMDSFVAQVRRELMTDAR